MFREFQYFSDLFLKNEFAEIPQTSIAPNLIVCGNIAPINRKIYYDFLLYCSQNWYNTFIVFGEYDLYIPGFNIIEHIGKVKKYAAELGNVHILDNNCVWIDKTDEVTEDCTDSTSIKIIGTTMWPEYNPNRKIKGDFWRDRNKTDVNYIKSEIQRDPCKKIIITHFPPYKYLFNEEYHTTAEIKQYSNYIYEHDPRISGWIFGNILTYERFHIEGAVLTANSLGSIPNTAFCEDSAEFMSNDRLDCYLYI